MAKVAFTSGWKEWEGVWRWHVLTTAAIVRERDRLVLSKPKLSKRDRARFELLGDALAALRQMELSTRHRPDPTLPLWPVRQMVNI